jgi:hypothetical protein
VKGQHATISKGIEGGKGNPTRIDRDKDGLIDSQTKSLLYNPRGCVCKIYLTFTLALKQRSKSSIFTPHNEQSILT